MFFCFLDICFFSVSTHLGLFKWVQLLPADFYQLTFVPNNNICSVRSQECKERWDKEVDQTLVWENLALSP